MSIRFFILALIILGSCVGVDFVDDPIVGERIELEMAQVALLKDETHQAVAVFYDQYGIQKETVFTWSSSNPQRATVNQQGLITALAAGQASIRIMAGTTESAIAINVVLNENQVAEVAIEVPGNKTSLKIGEMITVSSSVKNILNQPLAGKTIEWFSENSSLAAVTSTGVVTGLASGMVDIHAKSEGVKSNVITFSIGEGRSGNFVPAGGYKAVGMATLSTMDNKLILQLSANFETSFALGTFIYLANSTNGSQVRGSGLEISQITTNGAKTFDVSAISPSTSLFDYKYVIILCKPATVTFGYAELK